MQCSMLGVEGVSTPPIMSSLPPSLTPSLPLSLSLSLSPSLPLSLPLPPSLPPRRARALLFSLAQQPTLVFYAQHTLARDPLGGSVEL